MIFKAGDKVEFIYRNKKSAGVINGVYPGTQEVSIKQSDSPVDLLFSDKDVAKVEEPELVVVPQCVADWIERKKANGDQLYIAMDKSWQSMNYTVSDWLEEGEGRYNKFARAWLDGYEVEKEPLYYVKLPLPFGYLRRSKLYPASQNVEDASKYSEKEIKDMDERYWQFAVLVEELVGEA
ncbi:DUF1642 domain-containing protein [Listeria monocytogenes]|uniref:DUF1642 domain-containing protein n=1 Tax=Listeria monocytogenes TaxID=1639 RepID=UPI000E7359BC|nr:DUF1642 domain-containing protein [Listeria monocytogenes]EAC3496386.1 DUF1642 domain-containing protein [Listeria monocytogenes]EAC7381691.1 DUF1642 domain-containing protein [Listeria monocytogenes]EAC7384608.1 DUF1642 domain-containing protein [Listeria monocytogenes]EAC7387555.1 DUF1642 domain-containing protein [Listeria monocytogenes]EAC7390664.1 DUF1642 domain-containing protein [Listeria monocytogenes]